MKNLFAALVVFLLATSASAQLVISPGFGYYTSSNETTQPAGSAVDQELTETRIDARLGYVLPMGLYLGGMYSYISAENCTTGVCADSSGSLVGPTIGYHSLMGFYLLGTYHIMGEVGDSTKFTGGKGPQVDLGWVFPLAANFSIGPQLTWRSIEFDKIESAGVSVDTDAKTTSIAPYVSLWFMF